MTKGSDAEDQETRKVTASIGEKVYFLRKTAGLSQAQLGDAVGVTQSYIALLESGGQNVTVSVLSRLAGHFGKPINVFFPVDEKAMEGVADETYILLNTTMEKLLETVQLRARKDAELAADLSRAISSVAARLGQKARTPSLKAAKPTTKKRRT